MELLLGERVLRIQSGVGTRVFATYLYNGGGGGGGGVVSGAAADDSDKCDNNNINNKITTA